MEPPYSELPVTAQLAYADVVEQAAIRDTATGTGFSFLRREKSSGVYWYLQHGFAGQRRQYYVGADTPEVRQRIERVKERWREGRAEATFMQRLVAMASAAGCMEIDTRAYRVVHAAAVTGLFHAGGVLLGSRAFCALGNLLGVSWKQDSTVTQDIDQADGDRVTVAIPCDVQPLGSVIPDSSEGLLGIPILDARQPSSHFTVQGREFRVDLITPLQGKPAGPQFVSAIKAWAEPVAFLDYLLADPRKAVLLKGAGVLVNLPAPARFALHNLVVAQQRPPSQAARARQDRHMASLLIACLFNKRPGDLWQALDAASAYPSERFQTLLHRGIRALEDKRVAGALTGYWMSQAEDS